MIILKFLAGVGVGLVAHQTDHLITTLEEGANRVLWYRLSRYAVGILAILPVFWLMQRGAMDLLLRQLYAEQDKETRTAVGDKIAEVSTLNMLAAAVTVGIGVIIGHVLDGRKE